MRKGEDCIGVTVVYFCHDGSGSFVMARRSAQARDEQGRWDIGGGGVELHDTVEQTLRKEIKEEYGTEVRQAEFLGYRDVHCTHNGRPTHWLALDFKVLVDPSLVKNGEPHKFDEIGWFTLGKLPSPLHSQLPAFLEKYRTRL
ncbi:MAG TPA: NUDIX domain-containing protein [Patescibacteria group bacterium]|nr:NUDIX domain-containing protein [Patescibacteria group bacterium]